MAEVLKRTSYHPIFNEVLDFSTALLDAEGRLIASSMGVTVHLGALELSARAIIDHFGRRIWPGRRPHPQQPLSRAARTCRTWTSWRRSFTRAQLVAYAVARGHHGDIGGMHPGSFAGDTVSIFQEGVRIPPIKLYDARRAQRGCARPLPGQRARAPVHLGRPAGPGGRLPARRAGASRSCSPSTARGEMTRRHGVGHGLLRAAHAGRDRARFPTASTPSRTTWTTTASTRTVRSRST